MLCRSAWLLCAAVVGRRRAVRPLAMRSSRSSLSPSLWGSAVPAGFAWTSRMHASEAAEEAARRRSSEERLRVARELHDIIGHSLGTIAVQAGVGRHLMETEPEKAAEALDSIARISRDSLDEVRCRGRRTARRRAALPPGAQSR